MAEKINARKGDAKQSESQITAHAVMNGLTVQPAQAPVVSNKLIADQIAAKLNRKLCYVPMDKSESETQAQQLEGMYTTTYEEELEINDFPQSCRWKVTSREALGNITDYSDADIQIRGVYYPPGKVFYNFTIYHHFYHIYLNRNPAKGMNENYSCSLPDIPNYPSKRQRVK